MGHFLLKRREKVLIDFIHFFDLFSDFIKKHFPFSSFKTLRVSIFVNFINNPFVFVFKTATETVLFDQVFPHFLDLTDELNFNPWNFNHEVFNPCCFWFQNLSDSFEWFYCTLMGIFIAILAFFFFAKERLFLAGWIDAHPFDQVVSFASHLFVLSEHKLGLNGL